MAKKAKKPAGGKAFEELLPKLLDVPRKELEQAERRYQQRKAKKKKK